MFRVTVRKDELVSQRDLTLADYHYAFLTSRLFTLELSILQGVGLASPETTTREHLREVADGTAQSFALWSVKFQESSATSSEILMRASTPDQKPFCDTWWMIDHKKKDGDYCELVFGTALIAERESWIVWAATPLHRLYSRLLLASAKESLLQTAAEKKPD